MNYSSLPLAFSTPSTSTPLRARRCSAFRRPLGTHLLPGILAPCRRAWPIAFVELGVKPGDRVGLFAANCPEWHTADFAISGSGGVTVPIYFNESPDRMTYILNHCGAQVVFIAGARANAKVSRRSARNSPDLQQVIVADAGDALPPSIPSLRNPDRHRRRRRYRRLPHARLSGPSRQLASIIYTSGTTGEPKGVMLTHTNFSSNVTDSCANVELQARRVILAVSFLPLAHVYGRMLDYVFIFHG